MGDTRRAEATASRPDRSWMGWVALTLAIVYLVWYLIYAAYLAVVSGEGALPPTWRDPDVPAGAGVVSVEESCGSGGCARILAISPAEGQSARDLAREMGLRANQERSYGWRPTNPASVSFYLPDGYRDPGPLRVAVSYSRPFSS